MREKKPMLREKLRGFTILEMVVVIAIVGILLGVLVPSMRSYFIRSRMNTANSNAKVLFNSLQTICMEYELADRAGDSSVFYGSGREKGTGRVIPLTEGWIFLSSPESDLNQDDFGEIKQISSSMSVSSYATPSGTAQLTNLNANTPTSFRNRLLRLYQESGEICWAAIIKGYQVKTVWCAESGSTDYIGAYPVRRTEPSDNGMGEYADLDGLRAAMVSSDSAAWPHEDIMSFTTENVDPL